MRTKTTARTSAAIPIAAGSTGGKTSLSLRSTATTTVQIRKAAPSAAATSESRFAAAAGAREQVALRAQREEGRAVEGEEQHDREPAEHGVAVEQIPEASRRSRRSS